MTGLSPQVPRSEERDTTMRDLIAVVFKRKWLILSIVLGVSVVVGWTALTKEPSYSADARVMIMRQGSRASELERSARHLPWTEVVESEIELLKSAPVFQRAMEELNSPSERYPEGMGIGLFKLANSIKVGVMGESTVLFVQGTAEAPQKAVDITNAVADAYVAVHREVYQLPETTVFLRARADSTLRELRIAQEQRARLQETIGVTEVAAQEQAMIRLRENLRVSLVAAEQALTRHRTQLEEAEAYQSESREVIPFIFNVGSIQGNSVYAILEQLRGQKTKLQSLTQRYTDQHPQVAEVRAEIERLEGIARDGIEQVIGLKRNEVRVAQLEYEAIDRELDSLTEKLGLLPRARGEINILDTRIRDLEQQHKLLAEEAISSEVLSQSFQDYSVAVMSRALRGEINAGADVVRLVLAPLLALMFAIGLAFYLDNMDHSVSNRDDLERHFEIPVLASFPETSIESEEAEERKPRRRVPFGRASRG